MVVQEQLEADLDARFEALDAIPHRFQQFKLNFQAKASSVRVLRRTGICIGVMSPKFIWAPCAQLYPFSETPQTTPPSHLHTNSDSFTRALLISQDRRHLFMTPWVFGLVL